MGFTCSPAFPSSRRQTVPRTEGRGAHASIGSFARRVRDLGKVSAIRPPSACSLGARWDGRRFGRCVYLGQWDCRYGARRCRGSQKHTLNGRMASIAREIMHSRLRWPCGRSNHAIIRALALSLAVRSAACLLLVATHPHCPLCPQHRSPCFPNRVTAP